MLTLRYSYYRKIISLIIAAVFTFSLVVPPRTGFAQSISSLNLPPPGTMVAMSPGFTPPRMIALKLDPVNPLQFDFIVNTGELALLQEDFRVEADKLIKYFMASLTVPEDEL